MYIYFTITILLFAKNCILYQPQAIYILFVYQYKHPHIPHIRTLYIYRYITFNYSNRYNMLVWWVCNI